MRDTAPVLEPVDLTHFLENPASAAAECEKVAECLRSTGCIIVKDPRVDMEDNTRFIDMMEAYFGRDTGDKAAEARPDLAYQVQHASLIPARC
jgi:hypothetical protein